MILRQPLIQLTEWKALDAITNEAVQSLKLRLGKKAPRTINNVLAALRRLLGVHWNGD